MKMNLNQLFWIVPLSLFIGWTIGFYIGIPKHITIDYGENVVKLSDSLNALYNNMTKCPDCNCNYPESTYINYSYFNISDYHGGWYSRCKTCWEMI
jgi:hypothetical protein